jgi:hypothetical protein
MDSKIDKFLTYSNPLFWVLAIFTGLWWVLSSFTKYIGLDDWFFVLFRLKSMSPKNKNLLVQIFSEKKNKYFWIKEQAWKYAANKIKKSK